MGIARDMAVGLAAAVLGCGIVALVVVGGLDEWSFVPVPVMWAGVMVVVAPVDTVLRRRGLAMPLRAVPVVIAGATGFALVGLLLSGGMIGTAVMGLVYGMVIAACWAGLSAVARRRG